MRCGAVPVFFTVKLRARRVLIVDLKRVSCTGSRNFGWSKESSSSMESSVAVLLLSLAARLTCKTHCSAVVCINIRVKFYA